MRNKNEELKTATTNQVETIIKGGAATQEQQPPAPQVESDEVAKLKAELEKAKAETAQAKAEAAKVKKQNDEMLDELHTEKERKTKRVSYLFRQSTYEKLQYLQSVQKDSHGRRMSQGELLETIIRDAYKQQKDWEKDRLHLEEGDNENGD